MSKINGGATLWARQTIDSDIFYNKPDKWFKIWFYLVTKTNHKDNKQFKRGSCFLKYDWIMEKTGATKNQVKHCIEYLKREQMLVTQKAIRGFIIKVNKYNDFQTLDNYKKPQEKEHKRNTKGTQKEHKSHTINKYDKYDKYLEKDIKESGDSSSDKLKTKDKDPLEFSFKDKCWWGLYDWRIKMYQGTFPMLTINYLFNDKWKTKFLDDPEKYKKMIKEEYEGKVEKLVWAWLMQAKKFYIKDHPDYEERG